MTAQMQQTINLSGLTNATLSFWYNIPSLANCCDSTAVYIDNTPIWSRSSTNNSWQEAVLSLNAYVGAARTLRFEFASDSSGVAEGWYLDDILVTGYVRTNKFIVTTADDNGPGSLRQAILDANTNGGGFITFNLATGGVQVIAPVSPLPALAAPVNLDARTQPGYSSSPLIHLDGALVNGDGLAIEGGYTTVQGLAIHGFASGAGLVLRNGGNNTIQRCSVGTNNSGILVDQSSNNTLGGDTAQAGNVIAFNGGTGIRLLSGINNRIAVNSIYSNGASGLSLGGSPRANDVGDSDTGPNQWQNHPVLTDATSLGRITGTLNSAADQDFLIQFFANAACDLSGSGEGESWLGSLPVTTDQNGNVSFTFFFTATPGRDFITATATDSSGNTSEFSPCKQLRLIPTVTIVATDALAAEPSNPGTFTITRVGPLDAGLSVDYTLSGTAANGTDYGLLTGSVIIPAGANSTIIAISPLDDSLVELSETVIVTLSSNLEYVIGSPRTATVTILDNDLPAVSIRNTAVNEGNSGTNNAVFALTLSQPTSQTVTVNYTTSDGSALASADYVGKTGTVTFAPGATNQTISVGVLGETLLEDDEFFVVTLVSAVNATISVSRAVGTIFNDDTPPPPPPGAPGALRFDGLNDSLIVPDSASLNITNGITVEAWINRAVIGVQHSIVEKVGCTAGQGGYVLRVTAGNRLLFGTRDDCNTGTSVNGATSLAAGTWYHVAGVFDGAQLRVYVNGLLDGTLATTRNPKSGNAPLKIGERANGGTPFDGILDEVRIWNGARTAQQIQANMNRLLNGAPPGLSGYWRLDDGAGLAAADSSGNGNTATLVNGPLWMLATSPLAQRVTVTTLPASELAAASATLNGSVETDGYATMAYYQWGLTATLGNSTPPQYFGAGATTVLFAAPLNGLLPGTTYYYRLGAANLSGATNFGVIVSLATPGPPAVVTGPASDIAGTGATLHGTVDPRRVVTAIYFEWGRSKNYENATVPQSVAAGTGAVPVASALGGLSPATTYHYRLIGFNDDGIDVGADASFTTAQPPEAVTEPASDVTFQSTTLNAVVNPNGAGTAACFQWGLTTNYDRATAWQNAGADTESMAVSDVIQGLSFSTAYHFRVMASNNTGVVYGEDVAVTTSLPPPPAPGFSGSPTNGLRPLTVNFTNLTTGTATSFLWVFGDDTSDSAESPTHTFTNAGSYTVRLTSVGPGGSSTNVRVSYVTVTNPPPLAAFTGSPTSGDAPLVVLFTNRTTGIATNFTWDFGDGTVSSILNPTKTYSTLGTYTVTLRAIGPGGASTLVQPGSISVIRAPAPRVAVQLDGVNDFLNVPDSPNLRFIGPFTIEAWIRRATNNTQHSIVEKYGCSGLGGYVLRVASTNRLVFGPRDDCTQGTSVSGNTILASNAWYHVAGTWDGVTLRVYVNGVLDGTLPNNRPPRSGTTPLKIGERGNGGTPFQGSIDEVRLWSVARTTTQIQSNMSQCLVGNEAGLAGYWRLNEGAGLTALDSTTNANTATLSNGPLWVTSDAPMTCLLPAPAPSGGGGGGGGGGGVSFADGSPSLGLTVNGDHRTFLITVSAAPGRSYVIEASGDLTDWSRLSQFESPTGTFEYSGEMAPEAPARFYRVREP
jgi:PKD repeat protein